MISYHPRPFGGDKHGEARFYTSGFRVADTNDAERIARGVSGYVWAPGVYQGGYRAEKNFICADWIGLDFDSGELTLAAAVENVFTDYIHVIGTTMSHQVEKGGLPARDRFRVFLRLGERVSDIGLYRRQLEIAMDRWPCDAQCKDAARFFYACKEIVSVSSDGELLDVNRPSIQELQEDARWRRQMLERQAARVASKLIPPYVLSVLRLPWPPGTRNTRCFRIGAAMGTIGFTTSQIVEHILAGPTYQGSASQALLREITGAVERGVSRGFRDLEELKIIQSPPKRDAHDEE